MTNTKQPGLKGAYLEANRCLNCWDPPCSRGCPAGIEVSRFIKLINSDDLLGAAEIIEKNNPLGLICGYICPQESLCQKNCTSNKLGRGIDIKGLQHYVVEESRKSGLSNSFLNRQDIPSQNINIEGEINNIAINSDKDHKGKVAVIGAGPSGLVCGLFLKKLGYQVEVFEKNCFPGGKLTKGIPEFRLPKQVVEEELQDIIDLFTINYGKALGEDISLQSLSADGFDAVYLALGKWKNKMLTIPGSNLSGVYGFDAILADGGWRDQGYQKAAVIGAGNVAMDTARILIREGLEEVHIFFIATNNEVTAWKEEREDAWQDGVIFHMLAIPELVEEEGGKVKGLRFNRSQVIEKECGKWSVASLCNQYDFTYPIDMVVFAIGSDSDQEILAAQDLELDQMGHILIDDMMSTNIKGVYAGGDIVGLERGTVVQAVADGKRAALNIDNYLSGRDGNGK